MHSSARRACFQGLTDVVNRLLQTPNVTEQRDGRRDTPLMLARRCGHVHIEQLLLTAGAKDPAISQVPPSLRPGKPDASEQQQLHTTHL